MTKTCEHIKTSGDPCGSPALTGKPFCHFHDRFHDLTNIPGTDEYVVPVLEDHHSVQLFIMQISLAQIGRFISSNVAGEYLKLARMAMQNLRLMRDAPKK